MRYKTPNAQAMFETILSIVGIMLLFYGFVKFVNWARQDMRSREAVYTRSTAERRPNDRYEMKRLKIVD